MTLCPFCVLTKSKHAKTLVFLVASEVFKRSEVFGKSSEIFGSRRDVSGTPGHDRGQGENLTHLTRTKLPGKIYWDVDRKKDQERPYLNHLSKNLQLLL